MVMLGTDMKVAETPKDGLEDYKKFDGYEAWLKKEGVKVYEEFYFPSLAQIELGPGQHDLVGARGPGVERSLAVEALMRSLVVFAFDPSPEAPVERVERREVGVAEPGQELRDMRAAFLSRHLYKTYSGYVLSQFRLMRRNFEKTGKYKAKHAMHLIRLLYSGIHALRTGEILVDVGEHRDELLGIKAGSLSFEEVRTRALELDQVFQEAFAATTLPERPDYERVNRFLIEARRRMVDDAGTGQAR